MATPRTDVADPVVFSTVKDLDIVPCSFERAGAMAANGEAVDHSTALRSGREFECFQHSPQPGDALLIGLSNAVPSCAVVIRMNCRVSGVGVRPGLAAADLGGLDRRRLDRLRPGPGRHRRG